MISKLLFKIGQKLRNPSLQNWFLFLKSSEKWTSEELKAYQLTKLQELVCEAYRNSSYYKKLFDLHGVTPSDISSLKDITKIPILNKKELIDANDEIHSSFSYTKIFSASTSGTSGESLKFKREEGADSFNRASIFRGYSWYNVNPWDRNGYFWGFNFSIIGKLKTRVLDRLQNRFRIFGYGNKEITNFNKKLKTATFLHGYSSMIYETSKLINAKELKKPKNLKFVKGTSETIFKSYQKEVEKAFGVKMISEYGAAETGIIAFECPYGNMHINMEGVIVEEIENEIVVTNLQMLSFPIIRYKLGDYIKLAPEKKNCQCGMKHRIIEEVMGRVGETVYGVNKSYPSLYFYYIFKNLASKHSLYLTYQVLQQEKGKLLFLVEQNLTFQNVDLLKIEIENYFKKDIIFEIKSSQIIKTKNKKLKSFISSIN